MVLAMLLLCTAAAAQSSNELWTKLNMTKQAGEKWTVGIDVQYRRQNGLNGDKNMLSYPLASSVRLAAIYQLPHHWQLVTFPIAFFSNQVWNGTTNKLQTINDVRTAAGVAKAVTIGKLNNRNRLLYEFTSGRSTQPQRAIRHRYRLQTAFSFPLANLSSKLSLRYAFFDEVFVKTIKGTTTFDQNRLFNGLELKQAQSNMQVGYQWAAQKNTGGFVNRNQCLLVFNVRLP